MASRARQARAPLLFPNQASAALRLDEPATPTIRTSMSQLSSGTFDPMTELAEDHFDNIAQRSSASIPTRLSSRGQSHAGGEVLRESPDELDDFINHARRGAELARLKRARRRLQDCRFGYCDKNVGSLRLFGERSQRICACWRHTSIGSRRHQRALKSQYVSRQCCIYERGRGGYTQTDHAAKPACGQASQAT
ncbi:unnamed protein product, partial [Polarella glacialis]